MHTINPEIEDNISRREIATDTENEMEMSDEFINNFKSMYYVLNATPDTQMKVFNEGKVITIGDIEELCNKVNEKMKNHYTIIDLVTIYISFNDGRHEKLSIPEFKRKDWKVSATTKTVNINWNFYVKSPGYEAPQRHSLTVRMGSKLRPDEFFRIMMESDNDSEIDSMMADLVCRVDFVNAVLADELINRVEEWYKSLREDIQENKLMSFINKNSIKLNSFIELTAPILALLIIYGLTKRFLNTHSVSGIINSSEQLSNLLLWLVMSIIFVLILNYIGYYIASNNHRKSKSFLNYSHLSLTNGDFNGREKAKRVNKSLLREISLSFISTLLVTIVISIWGFFM